jgi:hypothetical protein
MPSASPRVVWLMPSIIRRVRTRLPTCLSIELRGFFAILEHYPNINVAANRPTESVFGTARILQHLYILCEQMAGYIVAARCSIDRGC